jgi:hypothetical protein
MLAWSQLDFSAILVSISAVSLTRRQTWQNVNSTRRLQKIKNVQEWKKTSEKRDIYLLLSLFLLIGRNFLLGNRKKKPKCLMRTLCHIFGPWDILDHWYSEMASEPP